MSERQPVLGCTAVGPAARKRHSGCVMFRPFRGDAWLWPCLPVLGSLRGEVQFTFFGWHRQRFSHKASHPFERREGCRWTPSLGGRFCEPSVWKPYPCLWPHDAHLRVRPLLSPARYMYNFFVNAAWLHKLVFVTSMTSNACLTFPLPSPCNDPPPCDMTEPLVRGGCLESQLPAHVRRLAAAVFGDPDPGRDGALALRWHGL